MSARKIALYTILFGLVLSCVGTTGSELVTFRAYGAGPSDAPASAGVDGLSFSTGRGWNVLLTRARLQMGAVYLNRSVPVSGGQERECFLPGVYVAEVLKGAQIDALSSRPQPFAEPGRGSTDRAVTGEVWLTGGRIDADEDRTIIADVAGTATRSGESIRFEGRITIGRNRRAEVTDPARPGRNPLCSSRIVTPVPVDLTPNAHGSLVVRVDPRGWFANVDFAELDVPSDPSGVRVFADDNVSQPSVSLFAGIRATSVYRFEWARGPTLD